MTLDPEPANRRRVDRYELLELIGEGGMGAVYRALDTRLGRTVALKTVLTTPRGTAAFNQELRQRFMREALAASKVEHRNVVQVIDFGVAEDGTPYLVMEYLRGTDLAGLLKDTPNLLPIEQVADIMLNVCAALRACHQAGIVHRDLKPSNIFLAETDTGPAVKVLDFGVSKAPMAGDLTQEGQILGTPQYLSPEQVNGKVGPESDQYALGVLLYVCLTNRLPFEEHQNLSLLRAIEAGRFPGPRFYRPELPEALEAIVLRAMHVDGKQRFESVHALGQALWSFASTRGQIEWKNYYFHATPPVSAHQATAPVVPPRSMPRTEILPTPAGTPGLTTPQHPQMMVSTRLAKLDAPAHGRRRPAGQLAAFRSGQPSRARRADVGGHRSGRRGAGAGRNPLAGSAQCTAGTAACRTPVASLHRRQRSSRRLRPRSTRRSCNRRRRRSRSPGRDRSSPSRRTTSRRGTRRPRGPTNSGDRPGIDNNGIGIPND